MELLWSLFTFSYSSVSLSDVSVVSDALADFESSSVTASLLSDVSVSLSVSTSADAFSSDYTLSESVLVSSFSTPATDSNAVNNSFTFILFTRYTLLSTTAA